MLEIGTQAPEFTLPDQNGELHSLSDYRGEKVVLYFYPRDNTAGCTKQASASAISTAAALSAISAAGQRRSPKPSMNNTAMNQQNTHLPHLAPEVRGGFDFRGTNLYPENV